MNKTKPEILIVEDDKRLSEINRRALESKGYALTAAYTLSEARLILKDSPKPFDIILLDVKLPDGMGFELCREIRPATDAYIIFLTSVTEDKGELEGLEAGGDDYLRKPYGIDLLRQRVKNALQRRAAENGANGQSQLIEMGNLTLDILTNRAIVNGLELSLSSKEFAILTLFAQNEGKIITTEQLLERIWNYDMERDSHVVKVAIARLRGKLKDSGYTVVFNKLDKGYTFEAE